MANEFNREHGDMGPQQDLRPTGSEDSATPPDLSARPDYFCDEHLIDGRQASGGIPWSATLPAMPDVNRDESTGELFGVQRRSHVTHFCDDGTIFLFDLED